MTVDGRRVALARALALPDALVAQLAEGGRIVCRAEMAARYVPRDSPTRLARQYWRYGQYRARTFLRHPSSCGPVRLAPPTTTPAPMCCVGDQCWTIEAGLEPLADALFGGDVVAGLLLGLGLGHLEGGAVAAEPFERRVERGQVGGGRRGLDHDVGPVRGGAHDAAPLNWTGMRAGASSLRSG